MPKENSRRQGGWVMLDLFTLPIGPEKIGESQRSPAITLRLEADRLGVRGAGV